MVLYMEDIKYEKKSASVRYLEHKFRCRKWFTLHVKTDISFTVSDYEKGLTAEYSTSVAKTQKHCFCLQERQ